MGCLRDLPRRIFLVYFFLKQQKPSVVHVFKSITESLHGESPCHSKVQELFVRPNLCHLAGCIPKAEDTGGVMCVLEGASAGIVPLSKVDTVLECMYRETNGCDVVDQFLEETGCVGKCKEQEGLHSPHRRLCFNATTEAGCQLISGPCNAAPESSSPPGVHVSVLSNVCRTTVTGTTSDTA